MDLKVRQHVFSSNTIPVFGVTHLPFRDTFHGSFVTTLLGLFTVQKREF